jgi:hypothetical protein
MATPAQIAANKSNAEGKAKSAMNRLTHGFASAQSIIPGESQEAFVALLEELLIEHQPATPTEEILVEKMAQTQWLTQRALNLQGEAFLEESGIPKHLGLLMRYYTTADRAFHRAHNELIKAQKQRKNPQIGFGPQKPAKPPVQPEEFEPKPAPTTEPEAPRALSIIKNAA